MRNGASSGVKVSPVKICFHALFALAAFVIGGLVLRSRAEKAGVWRMLESLTAALPATPAAADRVEGIDIVTSPLSPEGYQAGHVLLPNGESWRFAFRSHHLMGGDDSYSVFAGPPGTFRLRGPYFCCEVQFEEGKSGGEGHLPKDSPALFALLRDTHRSMEPVPVRR